MTATGEITLANNEKPWPKTEEELLAIIREHDSKQHDYGSVAESLVQVTLATFNYFASKHGMTGFQASWAEMKFLRLSRNLKGPFGIIDGTNLLYPQYDLRKKLEEWIEEWKPEIGKMAKKELVEMTDPPHPKVLAHWEMMAAYAPEEEASNDEDSREEPNTPAEAGNSSSGA